MISTYRKRPQHVTAIQFLKEVNDPRVLGVRLNEHGSIADYVEYEDAEIFVLVDITLGGPHQIFDTNWIVNVPGAKTQILTDHQFQKEYELVSVTDVPEQVLELSHG